MKVFKFGGVSIKDADSMRNVAGIIKSYRNGPLLVVISAVGKTTNALEDLAAHYHQQHVGSATRKFNEIKENHLQIVGALFSDAQHPVYQQCHTLFNKLENIPETHATDNYNQLYDQVVSFGEQLSTTIMTHLLQQEGVPAHWQDVREVLCTDNAWREAKIDYAATNTKVQDTIKPLLKDKIVITQGFIGGTDDGMTTTLGREGSDFTAAVFSNLLDAEEQTIWKDVPGVLNCNPRQFNDWIKIDRLNYLEAIEMTYYGAQVIHPKTIKPLQNKGIPLHVRSFIDTGQEGTIISNDELPQLPPIIVMKQNQVLLNMATKDFSFMAEENLSYMYEAFGKRRVKINMMQNAAISLTVCVDNIPDKLEPLLHDLQQHFNISTDDAVELLTIRHYNQDKIDSLAGGREQVLVQRTPETVQYVLRA